MMIRIVVMALVGLASSSALADPFESPTRVMRCTPVATDPTPIHALEIFRVGHSDLGLLVVTTSSPGIGTSSFAHLNVSYDGRNHDARYLQALQTIGVRDVHVGFNLVARVGHNQNATLWRSLRGVAQDVRLVCDSEPALAAN
jgi:hypothetical protein